MRLLAALLVAILAPAVAMADEPAVSVSASGCEGLDAAEVGRLATIEIRAASLLPGGAQVFEVTLACRDEEVGIAVFDQVTSKRLERTVPAPGPTEKGPERIVAIAASQLLVASWLELLVADRPQPEPTAEPRAVSMAQRAAERAVGKAPEARPDTGMIGAEGGVRMRALPEVLPVLHVGLRGGGQMTPGLWIIGRMAFERGVASRDAGDVEILMGLAGLGLVWLGQVAGPFHLEAGAWVSGGLGSLKGTPGAKNVEGTSVLGPTGEASLGVSPALRFGDVLVALDLEGGYAIRNPVGDVPNGDPVSAGGFFAGAELRIALLFQ